MKIRNILLALSLALLSFSFAASAQKKAPTHAGKSLVVYYSRTGQNYGVGDIKEGNTAVVARMIADATGADLFEVRPRKEYPADYTQCTKVARAEKDSNARPDILADHATEAYDTIYIGYPVWWGDAPMPLYTFIGKHDWKGKTIVPFCTHEGSGLSGTREIAAACKGANMLPGLAVKGTVAQNERDKARELVKAWLIKNNIAKK